MGYIYHSYKIDNFYQAIIGNTFIAIAPFFGGAAATISAVITSSDALEYLEAPVKLVTAIDSRVAYGVDGDAICLPTTDKLLAAVSEVMEY